MPRSSSAFCICPKFLERGSRDQLRLALLAGAFAHLLEPVVDQIQLQIVRVDAFGVQPEDAHALELERNAAGRREVAAGAC
jgi:hypothetical protein